METWEQDFNDWEHLLRKEIQSCKDIFERLIYKGL
jgi:hypothetical protein